MLNVLIHVGSQLRDIGCTGTVTMSRERYDELRREAELFNRGMLPPEGGFQSVSGLAIEVKDA